MNKCKDCKHWQCNNRLRDRTSYSDCYRVIGSLQPKLFLCYNQIDEVTREYFKVPFSPHDVKYWVYNERFMKLYSAIFPDGVWNCMIGSGFRCYQIREEDMKYDQQGAERMAVVKLHYFQTNKDYTCERWEAK